MNLLNNYFPPARDDLFPNTVPPPSATPKPGHGIGGPPNSNGTGPGSGSMYFVNPTGDPEDRYWGTGGCGPCVGVIARLPDGSLVIIHFSPGDNVTGTLTSIKFPPGTSFVVFGGDHSETSIPTLAAAIAWVKFMNDIHNGIFTLYVFPYAQGVWVNVNGHWVYKPDETKKKQTDIGGP